MTSLAGNIVFILLLLPALAYGADLEATGTTIQRFEERSVPGFEKQKAVPATQFVGVDAEKLGDGNLSVHLYGWGRLDLADKSTDEGSTDGNLTYGYLLYRLPKANGQVKGGRFFIYEGVANEQIDGVSARADLARGFALSLFAGAPVKLDRSNDNKGDYIGGGRVSYRVPGILELGVSALHEGGVDTGGTIATKTNVKNYRQLVGGDIWLSPQRMVELNGHTFYNTATEGIAEHGYLVTVRPLNVLSVSGTYDEARFQHFFATTGFLRTSPNSLFNPETGDKIRSYGLSATWIVARPVEVTADYKRYNYHREGHGNANRYGVEARLVLLDNKVRTGLSYHCSDNQTTGVNSYHEVRGYGLYNVARYFASADFITQIYDNTIYGKDTAYELTASAGYRIMPNLSLSGDLSYGENPRLTSEVRGLMKLTYNFTSESKGAK
jgi:hypothetical protein